MPESSNCSWWRTESQPRSCDSKSSAQHIINEPTPNPKGPEALLCQGSLVTPSTSVGSLWGLKPASRPLGLQGLRPLQDRKLFPVTKLQPVHPSPQATPLSLPLEGPGESVPVSVSLQGPDQQLEEDRQEAVTMDERPSVPRWVGEGEAGSPEALASGGLASAGRREAWDARACRVYLESPGSQAGEPFANTSPALLCGVPGPGPVWQECHFHSPLFVSRA